MTKEARGIPFDDFAADPSGVLQDLAHGREPVLVEMQGKVFRLEAAENVDAEAMRVYDRERVKRILRSTAGGFKGLDRRRFLAEMHAQREQSDRKPCP